MDLEQSDAKRRFQNVGTESWTVVHDSWRDQDTNGGVYCALSDPGRREKALSEPSWDLTVTDGAPGFSQSWRDGEEVTTYHEHTARDEGLEPLVLVREFYGVRPCYIELDQQLRLFHNLAHDQGSNRYYKVEDDGSEIVAVKVEGKRVSVRTFLLKQYAAARQKDLLLFIDSVVFGEPQDVLPQPQELDNEFSRAILTPSDKHGGMLERKFTRLLGTRVIPPGPVETCGKWPYEANDTNFPEFIIGDDAHGRPQSFTCDPDKLANYFGGNPEAPHYLTPVHFRKEVLQKYYEHPELYEVRDGYLSCAGLWGVQVDNDHVDRVVVFLGDLGRDLPSSERDYWRGYQLVPDAGISDTNLRRSFLGQFVDASSPDLNFKRMYETASRAWQRAKQWPLFKEPHGADRFLLQRFRLPLNDSSSEFETAVKIMTQLLIDSLNEASIQAELSEKVKDEKGIAKLGRLLQQMNYPQAGRDVAYLRKLQALRSRLTAHRKGADFEETLSKHLGDLRGRAAAASLLVEANMLLRDLRTYLEPEAAHTGELEAE